MKHFCIVLFLVSLASLSFAQQDSLPGTLDDVTVTATKAPKKLSETGKVLTIITKEQIEKSGGKDLAQLLTEQTGILVSGAVSNGGKDKSFYLLGATDKYTLFLLDGVPLNEPAGVGGSFDLRLLSLDNIERIEILKGSQSTLYGSNAVAGVVNIISKKATSSKPQFNGLATYGSYNSFKGNANISQNTKLLDYNVNYTYNKTDGISEAKDTTGTAGFDKDGYKKHAVQATVGFHVTDKIKITPYYRFSQFEGGYDEGAFTDGNDHYNAALVNTGFTGNMHYAKGTVYAEYGYDFTRRNYIAPAYSYESSGRFHHAEAYVQHTFNTNVQMIGGVAYQDYAITNFDSTNSMLSPYLSVLLHSNNGWNVELGARYNHHSKYGDNFTYSFNPSYLLNEKIKFFVNITSGFRAPSINELFGQFGANPNLKPEKSTTQEAGVQATVADKKLSFSITGFNRNIKDVIVFNDNYTYENRDKQHDYGMQAEISFQPMSKLSLKASYAYVDGKITEKSSGKDTSYFNLLRRPKNAINLFAGYQLTKQLYISANAQFIGKRTDSYFDLNTYASSPVELKSYALINLYTEYAFSKKLKVFADLRNLTNNTNFYEVYGYSVLGINVNAGVRFSL